MSWLESKEGEPLGRTLGQGVVGEIQEGLVQIVCAWVPESAIVVWKRPGNTVTTLITDHGS